MFITYKEVHRYVTQAEPGTIVGECGKPDSCIIAKALEQKYPKNHFLISKPTNKEIWMEASRVPGYWERVTCGDDAQKLYNLAVEFDKIGSYGYGVTREWALEVFDD